MAEPLLQVDSIAKRFGGVTALHDVSFAVPEGSIVGVIGPNGSGKTTLINLVTGIYRPDRGSIRFAGQAIDGRPARIARCGIARTFQNIRLFDDLSVLENVMVGSDTRLPTSYLGSLFGTAAARRSEANAKQQAMTLLSLVASDLSARATQAAGSLPYADKRRLEIVRALALCPRLLLLDEPAAGMSLEEIRSLIGEIRRLVADGLTVVLVEHKMRLIEGVTDKVIVLDHGLKIADAPFDQVRRQKNVVEAYLGRSYADAAA